MTNHQKRILAGTLVGMAIPTAIYLVLPKTPVVHTAYIFLIFSAVLAGASLWRISTGTRQDYLTNLAFPLALKQYLSVTVTLAVVFTLLDLLGTWSMEWTWYVALQVVFLCFIAWRLLSIGAGQEEIHRVGENIKAQVVSWKMIQADVNAILLSTSGELREDIAAVHDAIRYADPMSKPEIVSIDEAISRDIAELKELVQAGKADEVHTLSLQIQNEIQDRANRLKVLR